MSTTTTSTAPTIVSTRTPTTSTSEKPFLTAARKSGSCVQFWQSYVDSRPAPSEDFFQLIYDYHQSHGDPRAHIAHDIGTGPGNIASRLTTYFDRVVGSDINEGALEAAQAIIPKDRLKHMSFVHSPAESLAERTPPELGSQETTDLITISECMPLLDTSTTLKTARTLLRPGSTLAIYFYGPAIFADGNADECNAILDKIATRINSFNQPMKGTTGFSCHLRAAEALISNMDSIAIPSEEWEHVERHKWNCDHSILFNSKSGFDFDFSPVDRRTKGEQTIENNERAFWQHQWDVDDVKAYLDSVYPNWREKARARADDVEHLWQQLSAAMGSPKRNVTFSAVMILATKKEISELPKSSQVRLSPEHSGLGRLNESTPEAIQTAIELLQINHDEFHAFSKDNNDHNHLGQSLLNHLTLGASASELKCAFDNSFHTQCLKPELETDIFEGLSNESNLRAIFGQPSHYTNALTFFSQQIDNFGWQAIMHKYLFSRTSLADTLVARMYDGAYHLFTHLGLAVEFRLPSIMAETLAKAVVQPSSGIAECLLQIEQETDLLGVQEPHKPLVELYTEARAKSTVSKSAQEETIAETRGCIFNASKASTSSLAAQYRINPSELDLRAAEVINCSLQIAGACQTPEKSPKIDFFLMNSVASTIALTVLIRDSYISLENKVRLVEWKARTDLFGYAALGCPQFDVQEIYDYQPCPSVSMGWSELYAAVNKMQDGAHVAKFVRAVKCAENFCKPFEDLDPAAFPVKGERYLQLARMAYDTAVDFSEHSK